MEFINDPNFNHHFYKDAIRINYPDGAPTQLINDFGYSYIMFCYGPWEAMIKDGSNINVPVALVKPTGDYFRVTAPKGGVWVTFEMPTTYYHAITGLETADHSNYLTDLKTSLPDDLVEHLTKELTDVQEIDKLVSIMDDSLSSYYSQWSQPTAAQEIVTYIYERNGLLNLEDLLEAFPQSKRTLERLFSTWVGVPPYRFIKLVRFNFIIRELMEETKPLPQLIADYNYYDHSHFEKDFKNFMGQSIREYNNVFNPLLTGALERAYV